MCAQSYDIVMLVLNDVVHDARVRREAAALAGAGWRVLVIGTQRADGQQPDFETLQGFDLLRGRYRRLGAQKWWPWRWIRHGLQAWQIIETVNGVPTRAYHAHDLPALILLSLVKTLWRKPSALVYDSHELYLFMSVHRSRLFNFWHRLTRPAFMRLEGYLCRRADAVITLSESKARLLAMWYGIPRPVVVRNVIDPVGEGALAPIDLQEIVGNRRYIVHTGQITQQGRCLTELVEALKLLPLDVALVFLGRGYAEEQELSRLAERLRIRERVFLVPPVLPEQVPATIRTAAAAGVLLRSDDLNVRTSLPTKFFEALAGGVPVVTSSQYTVARVVRQFDLGECCLGNDPESIAAAFRKVFTPERQATCRAHIAAARQVINWQTEATRLDAVYREVLHD
jgi:glycosyltransferase involved in cell wall biosynthesis